MTVTTKRATALTALEFDRLLQDQGLQQEVVQAIAHSLRGTHGMGWLVALYNPGIQDRADIGLAVRDCMQGLARLGKAPEWSNIQHVAGLWVARYIKSRAERVSSLCELIDKTVSKNTGGAGVGGSRELIPSADRRASIAEEIERELETVYLGPEQTIASKTELLTLIGWTVRENLGAGALEDFLRDQTLTEIMVGHEGRIWVEKQGKVLDTKQTLPEDRARWFAQRLATLIGSRIDQSEPAMDGFLEDGSRVHVILPPVAMDGVSITIRRHSQRPTLEQLIGNAALTEEVAAFLRDTVVGMANILISGGTSSGKTTILNVVAGYIHDSQRVLTMEDAPELRLPIPHVIRLRIRKANIEGRGEFTMRMLVKESLRMRPDRIVVGEVRGGEALDMIEAMNTGHDGCLSTAHANGPVDMIKRLGQMMKRGDPQLTDSGAFELIASALHLIVHAERRVSADGQVTRGVMDVVELVGYTAERPGVLGFTVRPIFERGPDLVLRRVGSISEKLALHMTLNGVDPSPWRDSHGS